MGDLLLNVHDSYRIIVAVVDKELYGKKFVEGERQLDLTGDFFKGTEVSEAELTEEVERALAEDANFNIVGEKAVDYFRRRGIVKDDGVLTVDGVPFALVLL